MKISTTLVAASLALVGRASPLTESGPSDASLRSMPITRSGSELQLNGKKWLASGANVYWLGLDENVTPPAGQPYYAPYHASYPTKGRITEVMNTLRTMGANYIRSQTLGISVGNPLSLWPTLMTRNPQAFDTIDWAVYEARQHGIRIQMPLIDNYNYYHGGKYVFLEWSGISINLTDGYGSVDPRVMEFYDNATVVGHFKDYIHYLLTHKNQYTGLTYAEDPTIATIETGNELGGPIFGDEWVPNAWSEEIADYVKSLGPQKLVMDGTYGINETHFELGTLDIFSDHFYPLSVAKLEADVALVAESERAYFAGEYDWTGQYGGDSLDDFYAAIEAQAKKKSPIIMGDAFWSLFMHDVPNCHIYVNHTDGFELQYGNPLNTANQTGQIEIVRRHLFALQGKEVALATPKSACPGPVYEAGGT